MSYAEDPKDVLPMRTVRIKLTNLIKYQKTMGFLKGDIDPRDTTLIVVNEDDVELPTYTKNVNTYIKNAYSQHLLFEKIME